jgi:hypothetical protein
MAHECVHAGDIRDVTPSALGCESARRGCICASAGPAAMSAAATARRTVMQPSTFTRPAIRSSRAMIRRKAGDGVMSTRLFWTSADAPRRTMGRSGATFELAQQTTANES